MTTAARVGRSHGAVDRIAPHVLKSTVAAAIERDLGVAVEITAQGLVRFAAKLDAMIPHAGDVGGLVVGVFENLVGTYLPGVGNELKLPLALTLIVTVLVVRPAGMFGRPIFKRV